MGVLSPLVVLALVACSVEPSAGPVARFDLDSESVDDRPFPIELYRGVEGGVVLPPLPATWAAAAPLERMRAALEGRDGFCTTCAIRFPIDGVVELDGEWSEPSVEDPVLLVDVDPASTERGRLVPITARFSAVLGHATLRPAAGAVLREGTRYAAALTDGLSDRAGHALAPSDHLLQVREGRDPRRARPVSEAIAELERVGVDRERIVAATAFTTGLTSAPMRQVRALVHDGPPFRALVDRVVPAGPELDQLLGVPAGPGSGIDLPPVPGSGGDRAIPHATTAFVITGTFDAPRLVTGAGSAVGVLRRDARGQLEAGPRQAVPYVLIVPASTDLATLPVVVSLHGFNASRIVGFALGDTAGRAGAAVLAVDAFQHGERAASASDSRNAMRGLDEPDGLAETSTLDVTARVLGISGVTAGTELDPRYALAAFTQMAADAMAAVRLVTTGDLSEIRAASPGLSTLAFDPATVIVVGNSLGAEVASALLAAETDVAAYVLNVVPGAIVDNLVESPELRAVTDAIALPQLGVSVREDPLGLGVHPVVDLFRWALEPIDPLALAPHAGAALRGATPRPEVLVQLAGLDEVASVAASAAFVAAAELEARRFELAGHGMLEVHQQRSRYEPPAVPPLRLRPEAIVVRNPVDDVHAQIEALVRAQVERGP